ncbi:KaiB domain protein [Halothece sp. PCC 7418]|uniref:circadian clock KaiB family protein n=1 Tax=Halothece sp. (strain PCC 7418) TaxID=65093 RepID=UPI0002A08B17|nr:circadian clock KaiB family protein [Halothece sp. PCC 7418]AFZ42675.1 KaiB domain protein [Halothece sp. PCC 7418]
MSDDQSYKGIALFTPGGDLIYGFDADKSKRWHLDLCEGLKELLNLKESPHFLVPAYTATMDQWLDPKSNRIQVSCEVYPLVQRYQPLLHAIFGIQQQWTVLPWQEGYGDPRIMETYHEQFPQLWENHDLVVNLESLRGTPLEQAPTRSQSPVPAPTSYILRLFVSGHSHSTTEALTTLHRLLEQKLSNSYTLKVVDIMKHPEQAELNQVSATPTLVRLYPEPVRRIVGEWDNVDRILQLIATP